MNFVIQYLNVYYRLYIIFVYSVSFGTDFINASYSGSANDDASFSKSLVKRKLFVHIW